MPAYKGIGPDRHPTDPAVEYGRDHPDTDDWACDCGQTHRGRGPHDTPIRRIRRWWSR